MRTWAETNFGGRGRLLGGLLVILLFPGTPGVAERPNDSWSHAQAGLEHFYNLEYESALNRFQQALALEPHHPMFLNYLANTHLFRELYRTGQLDSRLYSESNEFLEAEKPVPDPEQMEKVKGLLAESKRLCTERVQQNSHDTAALYALGIAYGTEANYEFTLHKRWYAALKAGSKAKDFHERLKRLDPNSHDANLVLGLYEYTVGSIPRAVKWLALLVGHRGSKQRGIELLRSAMTQSRLAGTDAAVLLTVIFNRERKYAEAREILQRLAESYPRNYLLALEVAHTYMREGNEQGALKEYLRIAEKVEKRALGFERLSRQRLYYQIGSLHERCENYDQALEAFEKVTAAPEADGLLRAHASLRRGEVFLAQKRPEEARREWERVLALPYPGPRSEAQRYLQSLERRRR